MTGLNDPRRSFAAFQERGRRRVPIDPLLDRLDGSRPADVASPSKGVGISVRCAMTQNARSCGPEDHLAAAAMRMWEADCRFLPVVDSMGFPVGVLTDGDVCLFGATERHPLRQILVREVMSGPALTCRAEDDVLDALAIMREHHIRHLVVVDAEGMLGGVLSLTDLVICAEEEDSPRLRQEMASALRSIVQKDATTRTVRDNPFVAD